MENINKLISLILVVTIVGLMFSSCGESQSEQKGTAGEPRDGDTEVKRLPQFEIKTNQELVRPKGYRTWVYVGTPLTPDDKNNGKAGFPEFHNIYIHPESYGHYKETGKFKDGTILVKERISVGDTIATSGKGYFMGDFIALEAAVKSQKDFPDEPGNWGYYSFKADNETILKKSTTPFGTVNCNACHQSAAADDFVFTQYYPVLRVAKGIGKNIAPEDSPEREVSNFVKKQLSEK